MDLENVTQLHAANKKLSEVQTWSKHPHETSLMDLEELKLHMVFSLLLYIKINNTEKSLNNALSCNPHVKQEVY